MSPARSVLAEELGRRLRRHRLDLGLSGLEVAARAGVTQPSVSKIERGMMLPSAEVLERVLGVLGLGDEHRVDLRDLLSRAVDDAADRRRHGRGLALLDAIAERERNTRVLRSFSVSMIPPLLQTADYARYAARLTPWMSERELGRASALHLERQGVLFEQGRSFEFLLTESALRLCPGPPTLAATQADRLRVLSALPGVRIGIVPDAAAVRDVFPLYGFTLHDDAAVAVETYTGEHLLSRADEIAAHAAVLDGYAAVANYELETVTGLLTGDRRPTASIPAPAGAGTG
ncbi:MAG: helix-turn-helix domain-containing protein [Catenulispora sp.]